MEKIRGEVLQRSYVDTDTKTCVILIEADARQKVWVNMDLKANDLVNSLPIGQTVWVTGKREGERFFAVQLEKGR